MVPNKYRLYFLPVYFSGKRPSVTLRVMRVAFGLSLILASTAMAPLVADGVYTREQAERGRARYDSVCAECHGSALTDGTSPPLAGDQFTASWGRPDLTLDDLYYIVRKTMPKDTPGSLTTEDYSDIVAYVLQRNDFPPGDKELTPDPAVLKSVRFGAPASAATPIAPVSATALFPQR